MRLIPILLLVGMFAVSGWAQNGEFEPYSAELVKKAEAGDANAQRDLGICYYEGKGVEKDYKEAVKWFTKSAEQGNQFGQLNLGNCYYECTGVSKDLGEAVKWYTKSAEQGNWTSKEMLERLKSK